MSQTPPKYLLFWLTFKLVGHRYPRYGSNPIDPGRPGYPAAGSFEYPTFEIDAAVLQRVCSGAGSGVQDIGGRYHAHA